MFFKATRRVSNHMNFNSIQTALQTLNFFKKLNFCIFELKNCERIENSSTGMLNFSPLDAHIWAKFISISLALSQKKEIEKWPHRASVQCTYVLFVCLC